LKITCFEIFYINLEILIKRKFKKKLNLKKKFKTIFPQKQSPKQASVAHVIMFAPIFPFGLNNSLVEF